MTDASYRKALDELKKERARLVKDREELEHRLARVEAAIANLAVVINDTPFEGGLTEAVRIVLKRKAGKPMMPTEVRDGLKEIAYDFSPHTNIMASVHSVLKRLAETPDVSAVKSSVDGGFLYRWNSPIPVTGWGGQTPITPPLKLDPNSLAGMQEAVKELSKHFGTVDPKILKQFQAASDVTTSKALQELLAHLKGEKK